MLEKEIGFSTNFYFVSTLKLKTTIVCMALNKTALIFEPSLIMHVNVVHDA